MHAEGPAWSRDGSRLAFDSNRGGNYDIYVMNADGSGLFQVTHSSADDIFPTWSPDGSRLAFLSSRDGNWEVYVINLDGSGATNLTNDPAEDFSPAWSLILLTTSGALAFGLASYLFNWDRHNESRRGHPGLALLALTPYVAGVLLLG